MNIKLELIANNDAILFTSPSADPYSNEDALEMVDQNIITLNAIIGPENYDIGHVFGTGRTGGLAFLNSTCGSNKAGVVTGSNSPEGEAFNIDYVAHEIGHQLNASHTFNGYQQNCSTNNRIQNSAMEPGSGTSIMGYAGICGGDDLQKNSDAFFHSHRIAQIRSFTQTAAGVRCCTLTATLNNNPVVEAGKSYNVPAQTPFILTGVSSDMDGDPHLHSWEQIDTEKSSDLYSDLLNNPLFHVWNPESNPARYFPRLSDTLSNQSTLGELLPSTTRELNFSLLVRDNKGGIDSDSVKLNVIATGSEFSITGHNMPALLAPKQSFTISWNVADTDKAPINCNAIDIGFIDDRAHYAPLLNTTPNDGAETLQISHDIPKVLSSNIKVACSDNIFFAVSSSTHDVKGTKPVLKINKPSIIKGITSGKNLSYTLNLSAPATEEIFIHYQATAGEGVNTSR